MMMMTITEEKSTLRIPFELKNTEVQTCFHSYDRVNTVSDVGQRFCSVLDDIYKETFGFSYFFFSHALSS